MPSLRYNQLEFCVKKKYIDQKERKNLHSILRFNIQFIIKI